MIPLVFFAWAASIAYGLEAIMGKFASKHVMPDPLLFNFYWALFILILTSPIALWYGISIPTHWPALFAASIFYALGGVFYILALYRLDASVIAPLFSFRIAIAVLFGALILGEVLTADFFQPAEPHLPRCIFEFLPLRVRQVEVHRDSRYMCEFFDAKAIRQMVQ